MLRQLIMRMTGHSDQEEQNKVDAQIKKIEARKKERALATRTALDDEYTAYIRGHRDKRPE